MKKNKMMRLASALLVAVLLTTSVISGTYAKYVTEGSADDSARVAKWGVTINAKKGTDGSGMFSTTYAKNSTTSIDNTVVSTAKVVAPGTAGSLGSVELSGAPEVATRVELNVNLDLGDKWVVDGAVYCPIVFNVNGEEILIDGTNITDTAELEAAVELAVAKLITGDNTVTLTNHALTKEYPVTAEGFGTAGADVTVTWAWAINASDDVNDAINVKDTALGNAAAQDNAATISYSCSVKAIQID